jgi:SAM-dependent methyltransferase
MPHLNRERIYTTLRPMLPGPARRALRQLDRSLDPVGIWLYRKRSGETRPLPPRRIRERVTVDYVGDWFPSSEYSAERLHAMLERAGARLEDMERVLDFGCGAGKVIAILRGSGPELHGCDIDDASIEWLRRTYPDLHVFNNAFDPPLHYPDAHFDLVWAWSVLTHLEAHRQRAWVAEWARIIKPGGLLLATFRSPRELERVLTREGKDPAEPVAQLQRDGILFMEGDRSGTSADEYAGTTEVYGDTFNTPEAIRALLEPHFDVAELVADAAWNKQDCAIARKPAS